MQKKTIIRASLIAVIVLACALILRSTNTISGNSTCKESIEDCRKKSKPKNPNTNIIWESLSRQFFSTSEASY